MDNEERMKTIVDNLNSKLAEITSLYEAILNEKERTIIEMKRKIKGLEETINGSSDEEVLSTVIDEGASGEENEATANDDEGEDLGERSEEKDTMKPKKKQANAGEEVKTTESGEEETKTETVGQGARRRLTRNNNAV